MKEPSLDDLRLFLAVSEAGSLGEAARLTDASVPTLSRRMRDLEQQLSQRLFERGPLGYKLTVAGRRLAEDLAPLQSAIAQLPRVLAPRHRPRVRISAGPWTAEFLARHLTAPGTWIPEIVSGEARLDLARREADIGVRNARPDQPWLAGQRTARITYAVFASDPPPTGFIATQGSRAPSQHWLRDQHGASIVTTVNDARLGRDLALAAVGRVVLPRFAARGTALRQVGPAIDALAHDEWLVSHAEARHDPPVRAALTALAALLIDGGLRPEA